MDEARTSQAYRSWFETAVRAYQEAEAPLADAVRRRVQPIEDYSAPVQILVLAVERPPFDVVLVTHEANPKPFEIVIHGPFPRQEFLERADRALKAPFWNDAPPSEKGLSRSRPRFLWEPAQRFLAAAYEKLLYFTFDDSMRSRAESRGERAIFAPGGFSWIRRGSLLDLEPRESGSEGVRKAIAAVSGRGAPSGARVSEKHPKSNPDLPRVGLLVPSGFAIAFEPRVLVGTRRRPATVSLVEPRGFFAPDDRVVEGTLLGKRYMATHEGYVAVAEPERASAHRLLAALALALRLRGHRVDAVLSSDLAPFGLKSEGQWEFHMWESPKSLDVQSGPEFEGHLDRGPWIDAEGFAASVDLAGRLHSHPLFDDLLWIHQAATHLDAEECSQSFLFSWAVIEQGCHGLWRQSLQKMDLPKKRAKRLVDSRSFERLLEKLELTRVIEGATCERIDALRLTRNKAFHKRHEVSWDDAHQALLMAESLVLMLPSAGSLPAKPTFGDERRSAPSEREWPFV